MINKTEKRIIVINKKIQVDNFTKRKITIVKQQLDTLNKILKIFGFSERNTLNNAKKIIKNHIVNRVDNMMKEIVSSLDGLNIILEIFGFSKCNTIKTAKNIIKQYIHICIYDLCYVWKNITNDNEKNDPKYLLFKTKNDLVTHLKNNKNNIYPIKLAKKNGYACFLKKI